MYDDLEEFLSSVDSPERTSLLLDAYDAISCTGLNSHSYEIDQLLEEGESMDTAQTVIAIHECLVTVVEGCLNRFGVYVSDEAELKYMAGALRGLTLLDNYSDVETIENICNGDAGAEEKLAELLALVSEHDVSLYLLTFERVSQSLIDAVRGVLSLESAEVVLENNTYIKVRVRSFLTQYPEAWALEAAESGVKLGTDVDTVVGMFRDRFDDLQPQQAATELVGLVFLTDTPDDRLQAVLADWLEQLYPDLNFVTKAAQFIKAILPKVSYA